MRTVELTCSVCGKTFERLFGEHNRNQKKGRKTLCGRHCVGLSNKENLPAPTAESASHLDPANKLDDLSPFRWHLRNIRSHSKAKSREVTITLQDLKNQWDLQDGVCPYTGWSLKTMPTTNITHQLPLTPDRASLDRLDSTRGYVKDNIQFVSIMAQYAKHSFSEKQLLEFCRQVVRHECREREYGVAFAERGEVSNEQTGCFAA